MPAYPLSLPAPPAPPNHSSCRSSLPFPLGFPSSLRLPYTRRLTPAGALSLFSVLPSYKHTSCHMPPQRPEPDGRGRNSPACAVPHYTEVSGRLYTPTREKFFRTYAMENARLQHTEISGRFWIPLKSKNGPRHFMCRGLVTIRAGFYAMARLPFSCHTSWLLICRTAEDTVLAWPCLW